MRTIAAFLTVILLAAPAWAQNFQARVVGVHDGDTLTVLTAKKEQVKVRLWGVYAPETGQDFGARSKEAASELAFGKDVTVREKDKDRYGRTVAEVILPDGKSLNREMVRAGMAHWYRQYAPNDIELARLEGEAREVREAREAREAGEARRGLWGQPNPTPPWEWRKDGGVAVPMGAGAVGNRNSMVYHTPGCRSLGRMKAENRVVFRTAAEAEKADVGGDPAVAASQRPGAALPRQANAAAVTCAGNQTHQSAPVPMVTDLAL